MEPKRATTRMKTKMLTSFKNTFCNSNRQTKVCFEFENFNLKFCQYPAILTSRLVNRAGFKWLSKNQHQSNYSDQSQQEQTAPWTNQFLAITCNSLEAREKSRVHVAIGFGFASHWLKNWRDSFKPIAKPSNRNHVITFDSHLKTALIYTYQF